MIGTKQFVTVPASWALLLFVAAFGVSARAQSTFGSVLGTVEDATQAVIPGATVTLHSEDDASDRLTVSSESGDFQFVNLKPGHYIVSADRKSVV